MRRNVLYDRFIAVTKRTVYAEAGIPAYWLVDLNQSRVTCLRLAGEAYEAYADGPVVDVDWPVTVRLDAAALVRPPGKA